MNGFYTGRHAAVLAAAIVLGSLLAPLVQSVVPSTTPLPSTVPVSDRTPALSPVATPAGSPAPGVRDPSGLRASSASAANNPTLGCDGMYWSSNIWASYVPSWCYGHDEPTVSYLSSTAGSGGDANFRVTLPVDGATFTQGDFYATIWFGGTVYDTNSLDQQAFVEFQFYPAQPTSTGTGSGTKDCLPDGAFNYVYSAGSNEWFACAIVWQISGGVEDAAFAGPLDNGSSSAILVMHSQDVLWVNYSGVAKSTTQGWKISVGDTTAGTGGSVTLVNGPLVLPPYYSTATPANTLTWGASNPGAIAFAYEIGHSLNPSIPEGGAYGACYPGDGVCDSYWPGEWAQAGQMDLELPVMGKAGSQTYPSQIKFSSSQGGEAWINSTTFSKCGHPNSSILTNCLYPWYQYRSGSYGFTFDTSNVTNATYNYGSWYQFPSSMNGGQYNGRTVTAPWGTLQTAVSPLNATVEFNRLGQTNVLTVASNGSAGGQFEEGPYWLNVSAPGCTRLSTFVYMRTAAVDDLPSELSCNGVGPLTASAAASPTTGDAPLTVAFTGTASGGTTKYTYNWTFGDGATSTLESPSHTYASSGQFTAVFNVTDSHGDTAAASVPITVAGTLTVLASANPTSGTAPLAVQFTGGVSGGTPGYSYAWTFGDLGTSTAQNPTHTYASAGLFTAQFTVTDSQGTHASSSVTIRVGAPGFYTVTFNERGLPTGTSWTISVGGFTTSTNGSSLQFILGDGTHPYVASDANSSFRPVAALGNAVVSGANLTVNVSFEPVDYSVTFVESGLPVGLPWIVLLGGTNNSSFSSTLGFRLTNGTYAYRVVAPMGVTVTPASGNVSVKGANVTIDVVFVPELFVVTFEESGLPSGTSWTVTLNGVRESTASREYNFSVPDGNYPFTVTPLKGFNVTPASGNLSVHLANQTVHLLFVPPLYAVTFEESGLANGTAWSVNNNGLFENFTGVSFVLPLANGSYSYSTSTVAGYSVTNGSGTVHVSGHPVTVLVQYTRSSSLSSLSVWTWLLAALAVGLMAAGTVIYLIGYRRRREPPASPGS